MYLKYTALLLSTIVYIYKYLLIVSLLRFCMKMFVDNILLHSYG